MDMNRKQRGIFLITALIMVILVVMFVGAALTLSHGGAGAQAQRHDSKLAELACDTGIQYCAARLVDNPAWRGDGNGLVVEQSDGLTVYEDRGNIVGVLNESGAISQFRVRFNYQDDGEDDIDGLEDPANVAMRIDNPYVSLNNLAGSGAVPLPRGDGAGYSVTATSETPSEVPHGAVSLLVEGRAGPGLSHLTGNTPDTLNAAPRGRVQTRVVETTYTLSAPPLFDAAAQAAGHFDAYLESATSGEVTVSSADASPPRIRSKTEVEVALYGDSSVEARYVSPANGEVLTPDLSEFHANNVNNVPVNLEAGDFYRLAWDDVKKAEGGDPSLSAGTYVVWDDGSVHYYDLGYDQYVAFIESNPGDVGTEITTFPDGMSYDGNGKFTLAGNLLIEATGTTEDFTLIPRKGAQELPGDDSGGGSYSTPVPPGVPNSFSTAFNDWSNSSPAQLSPDGSVFQQFLLSLASEASFSMNGGAAALDWESGESVGIGTSVNSSVNLLMHGGAVLQVESNPNLELLTPEGGNLYRVNQTALTEWLAQGGGGMPPGVIDLTADPGAVATKTAADLEFHFSPPEGDSATLSNSGNIRLGTGVFGEGGSITSEGDIRIVGARTDLAANPNGVEGVNMYAKGNIDLFALVPDDATTAADDFKYANFELKGVIYTQQDFRAHLGYDHPSVNQWGVLSITGAIVAFGGDPDPDLEPKQDPGANGLGRIEVEANSANLVFDPTYLGGLLNSLPPTPLERAFFNRIR